MKKSRKVMATYHCRCGYVYVWNFHGLCTVSVSLLPKVITAVPKLKHQSPDLVILNASIV